MSRCQRTKPLIEGKSAVAIIITIISPFTSVFLIWIPDFGVFFVIA